MARVLIWNVETFGAGSALRGNYLALLDFLAAVVTEGNFDVFVIQELRRQGEQYLPQLQTLLGQGWDYDFLPGALATDARPDVAFDDLGYISNANFEGYAVLWGGNGLSSFDNGMSWKGQDDDESFINLVTSGATVHADPDSRLSIRAANPLDVPLGFPIPFCSSVSAYAPPDDRGKRRRLPLPNLDTITEMTRARNPCVCQVAGGGGNPVPVITYHAPNGTPASQYAAMLCGLSAPIRTTAATERVVAGGDFNVASVTQQSYAFRNFTNQGAAMAAGTRVGGAFTQTMVRYTTYQGNLIPRSAQRAQCLGSARDQLFYRTVAPGPGNVGVLDLLSMLYPQSGAFDQGLANAVFASPHIGAFVTQVANAGDLPPVVQGSQHGSTDLVNAFTNQAFPNWRTVAVFLNAFVSDHLPLFIQF